MSEYTVPYFIAANVDLWREWAKIQARGSGSASGKGWEIESREIDGDRSVMELRLFFERCPE